MGSYWITAVSQFKIGLAVRKSACELLEKGRHLPVLVNSTFESCSDARYLERSEIQGYRHGRPIDVRCMGVPSDGHLRYEGTNSFIWFERISYCG